MKCITKPYPGLALLLLCSFLQACSPGRQIGQFTDKALLRQPGMSAAQVGISLYDPATAHYVYNHQGDKYFIPASNTKLFSLYAGLKYLGDSLVGMRYRETDTALLILPSGDPTLLHPAFPSQPVIDLLKKTPRNIYLADVNWKDRPLGRGWAWDDYNDDYNSERSPFPVYGNLIRWVRDSVSSSFYSIPDVDWEVRFTTDTLKKVFSVQRDFNKNVFTITEGSGRNREQDVPFITEGVASAALLLKDTIGKAVTAVSQLPHWAGGGARNASGGGSASVATGGSGVAAALSKGRFPGFRVVYSRPVDSLFRPMMYHSDNFFAEQTLLMVSNERLGIMNDSRIIDTLLRSDLKELPQRPNWVDGCGLSRNDWFSPQDFIWILDKMRNEFGLERMKRILPTGGTGTLVSYYRQDSGYIFAKTGSLSGVVALSGYLITKKDHLYLFSVLVNNYTGNGVTLRRNIEKWIHNIRDTR
ncbi:MAG TPA: D-alanyl-D-alanine carboxypeptidase [Puia sp.]|jgi:D-alanyl-D-alanine carboxypeptidase/D-alanyl-D-alanine-endopeptidase (penicillin-binding protein 4)